MITEAEAALERSIQMTHLQHEAARYLGETLDPEQVYDRLHELLAAVVPHDGLLVSSYNPEDGLIRCDYAWTDNVKLDPATLPALPLNPEGKGIQSRVIRSGESLLINDVVERVQNREGTFYSLDAEGNVREVPDSGPPETRAAIMTPVKLAGQVVGVVQIMSDHVTYTDEQLELVEGVIAQMAAAARNAKLYEAAQWEITQRQKTEESLRTSEERFRVFTNAIPAIVWTAAPDGTITYANDQWFIYCGLTPEETAQNWPELVLHPDDYDRCVTQWTNALKEGLDYQIEVRNRRYDGEYRWFLTQAVPVRDAKGQITAWYGTTTDIHDRKQAEQKLQFLFDLGTQMRTVDDPEELRWVVVQMVGDYMELSRCYIGEVDHERSQFMVTRDYHRDLPSMAGIFLFSAFHPQLITAMQAGQTMVTNDTRTDPFTAAYYESYYGPMGIAARVSVPLLRDGKWAGTLWAAVDWPHVWSEQEINLLESVASRAWLVLERVRLDNALRQQRELLQKVFDTIPVMITLYQPDTNVLQLNREFERLTGWTTAEASEVDFMEKCYPDPQYRKEVRTYMESLQEGWRDILMTTRDGQPLDTSWANIRLSDETHIGIGLDIRERKRAEEALDYERAQLKGLNENLEQQVQVRTAQVRHLASALTLTEQQERRQLARELHDSAGQLLTALQIYIKLIIQEIPQELSAVREKMAEAVKMVQETQQEVRAISHAMRPPSLDQLGLQVALEELCHDLARRTGLQVHFQSDDLPPLDEQVSINFYRFLQEALNNTVKHSQADSVQVVVGYLDGELVVMVEDDGIGFDVQPALSPVAAAQTGMGMGMGLIGLQERFYLLGGQIEINSRPGQGTRLVARRVLTGDRVRG